MAITQNSARQYVLQGEVVVTFDDFTNTLATASPGETHAAVAIPKDSIVVGGQWITTTAYDDDASESFDMDIGDVASPIRYLNGADISGGAGVSQQHLLVPTGFVYTADLDVTASLTASSGSSTVTAGAGLLQVQYTTTGRANENLD